MRNSKLNNLKTYLFLLLAFVTTFIVPQAFAGDNYYDTYRSSHSRGIIDVAIVNDYGRRYREYPANGSSYKVKRSYLEAKDGKSYGIRVKNRSPERIGVVIAVDGRNIISGRKSRLKSKEKMYILNPYQTATYDGWRSGKNRVNEFYFTDVPDSYADRTFGDTSAMGVIAVAVFQEKNGRWHEYRGHRDYRKDKDYYDDYGNRQSPKHSPDVQKESGKQHGSVAPQSKGRSYDNYSDEAGTGYGEDRYSPTRRVRFKAESYSAEKHLIKYEWTNTLCAMGVKRCGYNKRNRIWDRNHNYGYAPPPPSRRYRHYGQGIH